MMKKRNLLSIIVLTIFMLINISCNKSTGIFEISSFQLLPLPQKTEKTGNPFLLDNTTAVLFDAGNHELALVNDFLRLHLKDLYQLELSTKSDNPAISLAIDANLGNDEAYILNINEKGVEIKGKTARAVFYGVQTLLQILPPEKKSFKGFKIPGLMIADEPQFKWRGLHFDVCRHFYSVDLVKKLIDVCASLKLNSFHWHLTDDQGWRIEIKKYPKLIETGAWRSKTVTTHMVEHPLKFDNTRHGGFYTQEQIKEVVEYAKTRFITIVPEIEMPGHAVAALAAYPEYSCTGGPFEVFPEWGISKDIYCAGKDQTFTFIEDILSEVVDLFPGEYVHIGGDECPKDRWNACPDCKKRMQNEKLKNANELQSYFIKRVEKFLNSKGKKLMGWDEILEGGLPERAAVMSWRGEMGGVEAASHGHDVVMTPNNDCYFDHYQGKYNEPLAIGGLTTLKDVYDYQPIPKDLDEKFKNHVLGSQANLWTEYIATPEHVEYMLFPRLCALAENLWTNESIQLYDDFLQRMDMEYKRLDIRRFNYRINPPQGFEDINRFTDDFVFVKLENGIPSSEIRYTIDGTEPDANSTLYKDSLKLDITEKKTLKAITVMPNGKKSEVMSGVFEKLVYHEPVQKDKPLKGINFIYYEDTVFSAKEINTKETKKGVLTCIKVPDGVRSYFFGLSFYGFIQIPEDEVYTFYLSSDDGSVLYVDNQLLVDNDGFHWTETKSGKMALKKGLHTIKINYYQAKYGYSIGVTIESKNMPKQEIPGNMLFY